MRPFQVIDCEQRSPEWFAARAGRVTGTAADAMLAKGRGKEESVQRAALRTRLAVEQFTGKPMQESNFTTAAMQRGVELEPVALATYEAVTGTLIQTTGFVSHVELMVGTSLDAHVGDFEGLVEVKCPEARAHLATLRTGFISEAYERQMMHGLWMTGAAWCDFVSFNPDFGDKLALKVIRRYAKDYDLAAYELALRLFLGEVEREYQALKELSA